MPRLPDDGEKPAFKFAGFKNPNYTLVPDEVFDELLTRLSGAELKVLLYVIRRTFGFKKDFDNISLSQMLNGIVRKDGSALDRGVGLSKPTLLQALRSLQDKNIIATERRRSADKGDQPTAYRLSFADAAKSEAPGKNPSPPVVKEFDQGGGKVSSPGPWANNLTTQDPVKQNPVLQEFEDSKIRKGSNEREDGDDDAPDRFGHRLAASARSHDIGGEGNGLEPIGDALQARYSGRGRPSREYSEDRQAILSFIQDFARELNDSAPLQSSVTRALNLYRQSGLSRAAFTDKLYQARAITQERSAGITATGEDAPGSFPRKRKMAYFFAVVEDRLGLKPEPAQRAPRGQ
ncbi:MAG: replication protein [Rubrobacter sp.]|nr:replication protein [Rubrobacter sp.]